MSIGKVRTLLYKVAKYLGDINAVRRGPKGIKRRVRNRIVGKFTGRLFK